MSGFKRAADRMPFNVRIQIKYHQWLKQQPDSMCLTIERLIEQEMQKELANNQDNS